MLCRRVGPGDVQEGGHGVLRVSLQGLSASVVGVSALVRNKRAPVVFGTGVCDGAAQCVRMQRQLK